MTSGAPARGMSDEPRLRVSPARVGDGGVEPLQLSSGPPVRAYANFMLAATFLLREHVARADDSDAGDDHAGRAEVGERVEHRCTCRRRRLEVARDVEDRGRL